MFRLMVANVRDYAIFMLDATGHVTTWNVGAERINGYTADEIIGSHFSRFYPEQDVEAGKCDMELEVAARDGRFEDEGWRVRKDGTQFWANVLISAVRDRQGNLVGFSKVTRDLTDRKRAEEERAARVGLEQANRTKDEFLAMLGHELRNPLAPILTALQLIKLRGDDPAAKEHEVIERQVKHMMHLVDDLLDVSRITKGKLELKRRPLDLRIALGKAIEIASPLFEQRNHTFHIDVPGHALGIDGDEARLTQVFANLMTNAAKYTEPGGRIDVCVRDDAGQLEVAVTDDGVGIGPELLPRIFDLFVQGYQSVERSAGGLGLGLTLVQQLVQMHGGSITAESDGPGMGSRFTVRLPSIALPAGSGAKRTGKPFAAASAAKRILLVDDNEDALVLLAEALRIAGHTVRTAADPTEALQVVAEFKPDFAILDIGLPMMDGYELAAKMRPELPGDTRLFALTGYGQPNDRERAMQAGFAAHFVKPVDVKQLIDRIERS